jgi:flagellar export protein FliJ
MSRFRFRLQKVLELRARMEKESATRLAAARHEAEAAQREREALEQARNRGIEEAEKAAGTPVAAGELQQIALMIQQLDEHLQAAEKAEGEADAKVGGLVVEFEQALTRRQVIDRLRERQLATWRESEERLDRSAMDAIAHNRHNNRSQNGGAA